MTVNIFFCMTEACMSETFSLKNLYLHINYVAAYVSTYVY